MYCDISGKIPSFLNNCLQESLGLESVMILITLFWILCVELLQKIMSLYALITNIYTQQIWRFITLLLDKIPIFFHPFPI